MTQRDWAGELVTVVAGEVRRWRLAQGVSAQRLADLTADHGHPIARSVIANLESGRRETISVAEVVVLARALRVPPILLLVPLGRYEHLPVIPDVDDGAPPWSIYKWFTGEGRFPGPYYGDDKPDPTTGLHRGYTDPEADWKVNAAAVQLFRRHVTEVDDWFTALTRYNKVGEANHQLELVVERRQRAEQSLVQIRDEMRRVGLTPPDLPFELEHIEEAQR